MHMLRLYSPADLAGCPLDKWGILDPGTRRHDAEGEREDGELRTSLPADSSDGHRRPGS
jgi:5-formyltetrahydrofolate cyclo-ligase